MAKRRKIGLIYRYDENWIGGTYYIQNLISALNILPENLKPELNIITNDNKHFEDLKRLTNYTYLKKLDFKKNNFFLKTLNRISRRLIKKNLLPEYHKNLSIVFPAFNEALFKCGQKFLHWIPDFQEHYYPDFFSEKEIMERKTYQVNLSKTTNCILFSSHSAKKDYENFYPGNRNKKFVLPFAVSINANNDSETVLKKYDIKQDYFICSNQFWKHKNHFLILKAIAILKNENYNVLVIFTGKEDDYRNPEYYRELILYTEELNIKNNVLFLGFVERQDQLSLLKASKAVIQPSLFEGWSTVIEDAKALNMGIIASDISVHHEQLRDYEFKQFFSSSNASDLANCLKKFTNETNFQYNYQERINDFGKGFFNVLTEVI